MSRAAKKIHYAGVVVTAKVEILAGWAACCYGAQAERIKEAGNHTYDREAVTCGRCLVVMKSAKRHEEGPRVST